MGKICNISHIPPNRWMVARVSKKQTQMVGNTPVSFSCQTLSWTHISLSQWLNFKLSGITRLIGKIKFKLLSQDPLAE